MLDAKKQIIELAVVLGTGILVFRYLLKDLLHAIGDCLEEGIDQARRIRSKWKTVPDPAKGKVD